MTIHELYLKGEEILNNVHENPEVAFHLLQFHFEIHSRLEYIEKKSQTISPQLIDEYLSDLDKYLQGMPLARITGQTTFFGHNFKVHQHVFCPRNETEWLVEHLSNRMVNEQLIVVEPCCGTGVIGLSLKKLFPMIDLYQNDIDQNAVNNTIENAQLLNVCSHVSCSRSLDDALKDNLKIDVLIVNPPYIANTSLDLGPYVDIYDPKTALFADHEGLGVYEEILNQAQLLMNKNQFIIALEIGFDQAESLIQITHKLFSDIDIEVIKDLNGLDRFLIISKNW